MDHRPTTNSPLAILLDLDDTILDDSSLVDACWSQACESHAERFAPVPVDDVLDSIRKLSRWYWSDPERHRSGRLELNAARREVVRLALVALNIADPAMAASIGDAYSRHRDEGMAPLPDAIDTVRWLKDRGTRLALLTNGAGPAQRAKIARFGLTELFDAILVEGEFGVGKPEEEIYLGALELLGARPSDAWMIGDNLEWDVAAPQRLGLCGVWIDRTGRGLPERSNVVPHHIVRGLLDVRSIIGRNSDQVESLSI
jgi:putative hydrolase of the HAD superfamily